MTFFLGQKNGKRCRIFNPQKNHLFLLARSLQLKKKGSKTTALSLHHFVTACSIQTPVFVEFFDSWETGVVHCLFFDLIHDSWKVFHPKCTMKKQINPLNIFFSYTYVYIYIPVYVYTYTYIYISHYIPGTPNDPLFQIRISATQKFIASFTVSCHEDGDTGNDCIGTAVRQGAKSAAWRHHASKKESLEKLGKVTPKHEKSIQSHIKGKFSR